MTVPSNCLTLLIGDFNAEVGTCHTGFEKELSNFIIRKRNNNDTRLLTLASMYRFGIGNTWFQHAPSRRAIWFSNDGRTEKMIDYILISHLFGSLLV